MWRITHRGVTQPKLYSCLITQGEGMSDKGAEDLIQSPTPLFPLPRCSFPHCYHLQGQRANTTAPLASPASASHASDVSPRIIHQQGVPHSYKQYPGDVLHRCDPTTEQLSRQNLGWTVPRTKSHHQLLLLLRDGSAVTGYTCCICSLLLSSSWQLVLGDNIQLGEKVSTPVRLWVIADIHNWSILIT